MSIRPEPPIAGDDTSTMVGSLERQRATFAWKCAGLERHVGHADLVREVVDGATGEDPPPDLPGYPR